MPKELINPAAAPAHRAQHAPVLAASTAQPQAPHLIQLQIVICRLDPRVPFPTAQVPAQKQYLQTAITQTNHPPLWGICFLLKTLSSHCLNTVIPAQAGIHCFTCIPLSLRANASLRGNPVNIHPTLSLAKNHQTR